MFFFFRRPYVIIKTPHSSGLSRSTLHVAILRLTSNEGVWICGVSRLHSKFDSYDVVSDVVAAIFAASVYA